MSIIIKAHFDGKTIVPDSELDLPADQPLEVEVRVLVPAEAPSGTPKGADLMSTPFFGMWAEREDMRDSAEWVRKEREKWSKRLTGTD